VGFRGTNLKLAEVIFDIQGKTSNMIIQFKMNLEQCSKFAGSKYKDNPSGATAAIRTRMEPSNVESTTPAKGANKLDITI
jgi:hypothetical protein